MKKLLLASVGVVAMATAAAAADLPARYPARAPAYVAQVYNWTGFYVGAHVGWGRVDLGTTIIAPAGLGSASGDENGFLGGGQIGFNYQFGAWVIGVEGDIAWTDIDRTTTASSLALGLTATDRASVDWIATLTARLGYAWGPALLYLKGGVAWMDWSASTTVSTFPGAPVLIGAGSFGQTETGWTVGVGFEYGFTPNWSAKIEYNYLDFGTERTVFGGPLTGLVVDTDLTSHIVKAGINYRFGGWR